MEPKIKVKQVKGGFDHKTDGFVVYAVGNEGQTAKSNWSADEEFAKKQAREFFDRGFFLSGQLIKGLFSFLFGPNDTYL